MNIVRALDVALPELHAQRKLQLLPKAERSLIAREHLEGGVPTVMVIKPKSDCYYRLSPDEWAALQLFNGKRSYQEITEAFQEQTGKSCSEEDIRMFARLTELNKSAFNKVLNNHDGIVFLVRPQGFASFRKSFQLTQGLNLKTCYEPIDADWRVALAGEGK